MGARAVLQLIGIIPVLFVNAPSIARAAPASRSEAVIVALQCSANTVQREVRVSQWGRVSRSVMDIATDEHDLEVALNGAVPQQRTVVALRQAVFALVDADAAHSTAKTVQAVQRILACCTELKKGNTLCRRGVSENAE